MKKTTKESSEPAAATVDCKFLRRVIHDRATLSGVRSVLDDLLQYITVELSQGNDLNNLNTRNQQGPEPQLTGLKAEGSQRNQQGPEPQLTGLKAEGSQDSSGNRRTSSFHLLRSKFLGVAPNQTPLRQSNKVGGISRRYGCLIRQVSRGEVKVRRMAAACATAEESSESSNMQTQQGQHGVKPLTKRSVLATIKKFETIGAIHSGNTCPAVRRKGKDADRRVTSLVSRWETNDRFQESQRTGKGTAANIFTVNDSVMNVDEKVLKQQSDSSEENNNTGKCEQGMGDGLLNTGVSNTCCTDHSAETAKGMTNANTTGEEINEKNPGSGSHVSPHTQRQVKFASEEVNFLCDATEWNSVERGTNLCITVEPQHNINVALVSLPQQLRCLCSPVSPLLIPLRKDSLQSDRLSDVISDNVGDKSKDLTTDTDATCSIALHEKESNASIPSMTDLCEVISSDLKSKQHGQVDFCEVMSSDSKPNQYGQADAREPLLNDLKASQGDLYEFKNIDFGEQKPQVNNSIPSQADFHELKSHSSQSAKADFCQNKSNDSIPDQIYFHDQKSNNLHTDHADFNEQMLNDSKPSQIDICHQRSNDSKPSNTPTDNINYSEQMLHGSKPSRTDLSDLNSNESKPNQSDLFVDPQLHDSTQTFCQLQQQTKLLTLPREVIEGLHENVPVSTEHVSNEECHGTSIPRVMEPAHHSTQSVLSSSSSTSSSKTVHEEADYGRLSGITQLVDSSQRTDDSHTMTGDQRPPQMDVVESHCPKPTERSKYRSFNYGDPTLKKTYVPKTIRFTDTFNF